MGFLYPLQHPTIVCPGNTWIKGKMSAGLTWEAHPGGPKRLRPKYFGHVVVEELRIGLYLLSC